MSTDGYKETKIGRIPEEWDVKTFSDLFLNISRKNNPNERLLSVTQANGLVYRDEQNRRVMSPEGSVKNYKLVKPGDFIISLRSFQGGIEYSNKKGLVSPAYTVLNKTKTIIDTFYKYYFKKESFINSISNIVSGIREGKNIKYTDVKYLLLPFPPLSEQRKIAEILSTVDAAIEKTDAIIEETKQLKKGLMQKLFTEGIGHIRFKETKIGRIPEEWEIVKLGDSRYSKLLTGGTPNTKIKHYWGGEIPWMVSGDIHKKYIYDVDGRITEDGLKNSAAKYLPVNSILVALNGQGRTKGTVAINLKEITCNQSIAAYVLNENEFYPLFLFNFLTYQYKKLRALSGDSDRAGLNLGLLRNVLSPKPNIPEQKKIAEILFEVDAKIETGEAIRGELEELKRGLMQVLLTGQVRVKV